VKGRGAVECFLRHHIEKKAYRPYSAVAKAEMRLPARERLWDWPDRYLNSTLFWISGLIMVKIDRMANFDERAKEHVGSVTFECYIVPQKVIGKDKDNTETSSRWAVKSYYVHRMVNICFM
jgi:hypothetical protein